MTPEERAEAILAQPETFEFKVEDNGQWTYGLNADALTSLIAHAIRDAVDEAGAATKQAIQERDEANRERNRAELQAATHWKAYLEKNGECQGYAKERDRLLIEREQARAALEPFAKLADYYRDVADRRFNLEGDVPTISSDQLRVVRDAYRALGGKIE